MARNVAHSGKVHPGGIVPKAPGPTVTKNDPAKFHGAGKTSGKPDSDNTIVSEREGPTLTLNRTHIPSTDADKSPKVSKQISERTGTYKPEDTACDKTASQMDGGGPTDRPYPLAKRYDKHGKTDRKTA
jgi:hypothetical protein